MTKAEHTPGPWEVIPNDDARSWDVWGPDLSIEAPICDVLSEANARFIAAAPDMLEALELCIKEFKGLAGAAAVAAYNAGKAAIAKARGE